VTESPSLSVLFTPPPTPNGGLHVGHVSGPYLRADLNCRLANALGHAATHCSHVDNYQTYVATKAHQLGRDPYELRQEMTSLIAKDFADFGIGVRWNVDNTAPNYRSFLDGALTELFSDVRATGRVEFVGTDPRRGAAEAFVAVTCPQCLQRASLNVCENCARPLDLSDAIDAVEESTGNRTFIEGDSGEFPATLTITEDDLSFVRAQYRHGLVFDNAFVAALLQDLSAHSVALTFRSDYGYEVGPGRVINPWIEIFFAHAYSLGLVLGLPETMSVAQLRTALESRRGVEVSYYFGSDNAYYYAVLFPLLAKIMRFPALLPVALKANRFLRLNGRKMSSSRSNAIWARDLTPDGPGRLLRRELAMSCPEYAEQELRNPSDHSDLDWPAAEPEARPVFDNPATEIGRCFRVGLGKEAHPQRFSVAGLLKRIDKAVEYTNLSHGSAAERSELTAMVGYLLAALEL
jgi:methionyl-tRNA synthetase